MSTLSFAYLILTSFTDQDITVDPLFRLWMVLLGGSITSAASLVVFPTYAGDQLRSSTASNLSAASLLVSDVGGSLDLPARGGARGGAAGAALVRDMQARVTQLMSSAANEASLVRAPSFLPSFAPSLPP